MGEIIESPLTDEELKEKGIEIPEDETEEKFFNWFDEMFEEVFGEDEEWKEMHRKNNK